MNAPKFASPKKIEAAKGLGIKNSVLKLFKKDLFE
jgi:hypothetical protein